MPESFVVLPTFATTATQPPVLMNGTTNSDQSEDVSLKKVLHVINGEHFSGAERVQQLLGQRLAAEQFDAHFVCIKAGKFATHANLPADHVHAAYMEHRFDHKILKRVCDVALTKKADILHAHTPRSALITAIVAAKTKLPWVFHVHSPTARDSTRQWLNRINGFVEKQTLKRCNAVLTVSESLRDEMLRRGVPANKIFVAANGVAVREPIAVKPRVASHTWRFGAVALFRPRKGLELLLQAFENLCETSQSANRFSLDIIGGFETENYERSIRLQLARMHHRDKVCLHGFVKDAPDRMRNLDILVLPSTFGEGMPMVVLEAMANGVPIVATRVEGTPEVVRDGVEGWLAEPNDVASLERAMLAATENRVVWSQFAANAFKRQCDRFSDVTMAAAVAEVYRHVLHTQRT